MFLIQSVLFGWRASKRRDIPITQHIIGHLMGPITCWMMVGTLETRARSLFFLEQAFNVELEFSIIRVMH